MTFRNRRRHVHDTSRGGRVILAQEGTELVGNLLPAPECVLLGAGQDSDRSGFSAIFGRRCWAGTASQVCPYLVQLPVEP